MPITQDMRARVENLLNNRAHRRILGIVGGPGSGKSTLAAAIAEAFPTQSVVVPMDGFHLAQRELERLGRAERKGAPDTFDAAGFAALLARIDSPRDATIYAPLFAREIEEPIANAIPVPPEKRLVIVEGNYLLCDGPWAEVRERLDEAWFLDTPEERREAWLLARHIAFGRTPEAARARIETTDAPNARLIDATRGHADWIVAPA